MIPKNVTQFGHHPWVLVSRVNAKGPLHWRLFIFVLQDETIFNVSEQNGRQV